MEGGAARLHLTLTEAGMVRIRLHADRDVVVHAAGQRLALRRASSGVLDVPVPPGGLALELTVDSAKLPPGLWLTGVSFHP